jgi:hypothetical protein
MHGLHPRRAVRTELIPDSPRTTITHPEGGVTMNGKKIGLYLLVLAAIAIWPAAISAQNVRPAVSPTRELRELDVSVAAQDTNN